MTNNVINSPYITFKTKKQTTTYSNIEMKNEKVNKINIVKWQWNYTLWQFKSLNNKK